MQRNKAGGVCALPAVPAGADSLANAGHAYPGVGGRIANQLRLSWGCEERLTGGFDVDAISDLDPTQFRFLLDAGRLGKEGACRARCA
jgi:hypothetical protein